MIDPNKTNTGENSVGNKTTGWEVVEAEAGKMKTPDQVANFSEKTPSQKEVNALCEKVLGRSSDDTGRELQLLDFINGYRTMEYKDPDKHRELLEIAASGTAIGREDTDYEDGEMKGLKHTITAIMPDGTRVTEERIYSTLKPELKSDKIARYVYDGVLEESDAQTIRTIHGLLEGRGGDLEQAEIEELRSKGGEIKNKVMHHYNEMYKGELFHDDGNDKEGLKHVELDGGQKVIIFSGADFKMLAHVRFAMEMSTGKRTAEDLMQGDPVSDWNLPHKDKNGKEMEPPHALSTSLISSEKIHLYKPSEIIYGFTDFEGDGIVTMGTEDLASYSNGPSKYAIRSARFNERMMSPDELIATTGARREENGETYNEVVVDRYSGKNGGIIQPNCLIVFGKDETAITPLQRKHAEAFGVPIYVIDSEKYGGVKTTWGEKSVPKSDEVTIESEHAGSEDGNNPTRPESRDKDAVAKRKNLRGVFDSISNFFERAKAMRAQRNERKESSIEAEQGVKHNSKLQSIYDSIIASGLEDWEAQYEIQNKFQEFNMNEETPFLASGQSSYFNEQIDQNGMSGLKLREQDIEDARFIAECFGKKASFSEDNLDILYTTLPGTTEMNYATQTFPAIIFEDVFQCSATHELPFSPKVGEKEEDYWVRVLDAKIAEAKDFPQDKIEEVRERGMRIAKNFCTGKNRIYLIPIKDVLANKASFGDIMGVRGGESKDGKTTDDIMSEVLSLENLSAAFGRDPNNVSELYGDPNFSSEYGIAIYGKIPQENIQCVEVERGYDIMQRKAKQKGLKDGEEIDLSEQPFFS